MQIQIDPERDSDNTAKPAKVTFTGHEDIIRVKLINPDRTIEFRTTELILALDAIARQDAV